MPFWSRNTQPKPPIRERFKQGVKKSVDNYTAPMRTMWGILGTLTGSIRRQLSVTPERNLAIETALRSNYFALMVYWGFNEEQTPYVLKGLKTEALAFTIFALAMFALTLYRAWGHAYFDVLVCFAGTLAATTVVCTRLWRKHVIVSRQYVPFTEWLGFGS